MTVKEFLFNNVRGRVRGILWANIINEFDAANEKEPLSEAKQIRTLYNITKRFYKKYEPLIKEMDNEEEAKV